MGFYGVLFVGLVATGAITQLSDDQASEEIRATIPLIRNTFIVDEFDAEGLRGRDLYLDPPRTLVYEYEYNWALTDSILTLEPTNRLSAHPLIYLGGDYHYHNGS